MNNETSLGGIKLQYENNEQPCYVTHGGSSKITWNILDKKVDEIMLSLSGYCYEDIELVAKCIIIKSKKHPIDIK